MPKWRQGIRRAADEGSKDPVTFEPAHPEGKGRFDQTF